MEYVFNHMDLHRGQRILQVAFGSGFKCNTAVWLCLNKRRNNSDSYENKKNK
jgi:3-ketoacyl-CoA synthase